MGKYQGYEQYKDSGVEWLGEIPKHWEVTKLKYVGKFINGYSFNSNDFTQDGVRVLKISNIQHMTIDWSDESFIDEKYYETASSFRVYKNDLVFALTRPIISSGIKAAIVENNEKILINQRNCVFRSNAELSNKWIYYILLCSSFLKEFELRIDRTGQQPNISSNDIADIYIPTVNWEEQNTIAQFLDHKTSQIDALISKKEALLEKLDEKRTALISHAVTKGLDPSVPMKDSSIEWLGDIPAHWTMGRVKHLAKTITKGTTPSTEGQTFTESGIRYIKAENIVDNKIALYPEFFISEETDEVLKRSRLQENDILFVIAGATIGKTAIFHKKYIPANTNQAVSLIRPNDKVMPEFLHLWLQSDFVKNILTIFSVQSAQPNISMESLGEISTYIPPLDEQSKIIKYLDQKTTEIDQQKAKIQQAIDLLKEYRTALITNAVTGKIDVRQVPIPQP